MSKVTKSRSAIDLCIGARVRARRRALRLTLAKLSSDLGLTLQQVQRYERGINRISAATLYEMACVMDVEVAYFFETLPSPPADSQRSHGRELVITLLESAEGLMLAEAFPKVRSHQIQKKILELVVDLAALQQAGRPGAD